MSKNVMTHKFSEVPKVQIPRSKIKIPHSHLTTLDSGYLVPIYAYEFMPGSTVQMTMKSFGRLMTQFLPVMDNAYVDVHFFAIPHRILWDNWTKLHGERANPTSSIDFTVPKITLTSPVTTGSIHDYLGVPTGVNGLKVNTLFHRAYNKIYNEWYRDTNIINSVVEATGDTDDITNYTLLKRGKRKDLFTSCLPAPQKGDGVEIPLGLTAPVTTSTVEQFTNDRPALKGRLTGGILPGTNSALGHATDGTVYQSSSLVTGTGNKFFPTNLYADLSQATSASINSLRLAFQLQRLLERDARGGTRYTEMLKSHFGVTSPDFRLQRPEFLGGSTAKIQQNVVAQTSSTDTTSPQGNLSAFSTFSDVLNFTHSCTEHMIIMGIASVRTDMRYQYGLQKKFSRQTRYDYPYPVLANLGEQPVLNKEIYAQGTSADDQVFGYNEAWYDFRYKPSIITGKMNSKDPQSLDGWHYAQKFTNLPTLNQSFIEENPEISRSIAVQDEPEILLECFFDETNIIPLPMYSVPGQIDHF